MGGAEAVHAFSVSFIPRFDCRREFDSNLRCNACSRTSAPKQRANASRLLPQYSADPCGAWIRDARRSRAEPLLVERSRHRTLAPLAEAHAQGGAWRTLCELALVKRAEALRQRSCFVCRCAAEARKCEGSTCRSRTVRTVRVADSARPPNGLEVNPRGQGPRGYGSAAHGLPACESRDAGRVPPCRF